LFDQTHARLTLNIYVGTEGGARAFLDTFFALEKSINAKVSSFQETNFKYHQKVMLNHSSAIDNVHTIRFILTSNKTYLCKKNKTVIRLTI